MERTIIPPTLGDRSHGKLGPGRKLGGDQAPYQSRIDFHFAEIQKPAIFAGFNRSS
jgi:hypothetical protein